MIDINDIDIGKMFFPEYFLIPNITITGNAIVQDIRTTYYYEIRIVLIFNLNTYKYNAYIIDYIEDHSMTEDADEIIKYFEPLPLGEAIRSFSTYQFDENNYGF